MIVFFALYFNKSQGNTPASPQLRKSSNAVGDSTTRKLDTTKLYDEGNENKVDNSYTDNQMEVAPVIVPTNQLDESEETISKEHLFAGGHIDGQHIRADMDDSLQTLLSNDEKTSTASMVTELLKNDRSISVTNNSMKNEGIQVEEEEEVVEVEKEDEEERQPTGRNVNEVAEEEVITKVPTPLPTMKVIEPDLNKEINPEYVLKEMMKANDEKNKKNKKHVMKMFSDVREGPLAVNHVDLNNLNNNLNNKGSEEEKEEKVTLIHHIELHHGKPMKSRSGSSSSGASSSSSSDGGGSRSGSSSSSASSSDDGGGGGDSKSKHEQHENWEEKLLKVAYEKVRLQV
jgi:hypothetical protein